MSSVSQAQPQGRPRHLPPAPAGVSMRDLLASCAAATAVSTPPRAPEPEARGPVRDQQGQQGRQGRQDRQSHREAA
ncbi:hypothetical protein GCM10010095_51310 [Streptomyces anthocyanicus]|uniref:hypothetical protein n=1 Tax=Streptomyces TaxID=1883 RepID=UPI0016713025|nr:MULTISPECIES: hypothetical protein [Streptomyces]MDX3371115.1 hypothetical protein [Streptomyces sp. ME02-6987-2C]MDX3411753.1 hypothetical protein [Streptomyces sp. ME02-6977A]MDX3424026.1 hypothetical protein [Streptomyces sp. ME02-6985-2c]GGL59879.1 hypothetical protein GCM10010095_51310 [Streptomyces anthocyanicus]